MSLLLPDALFQTELPPSCACGQAHSRRPVHDIEKWDGGFFSDCELRDVGLLVHLGHGGQDAPSAPPTTVPKQVRINKGPPSTIPRNFGAAAVQRAAGGSTGLRINRGLPSSIPRDFAASAVQRAAGGSAGPTGFPPGFTAQVTDAIRTLSRPAPDAENPRPEAVARQRERAARVARDERERAEYIATHGGGAVRRSGPRIRPRPVPGADAGTRAPREEDLSESDLYLDAARPPVLEPRQPHHKCGICFAVKSHPVSYKCGHSHCYTCIRVWLEKRWTCPECVTGHELRAFPSFRGENALAADYPERAQDHSRVSYSFADLKFPRAARPLIAPDTP
ncbi:hypothetical protein B0H11DRAFT_2259000 [Mycena galericulata]|nr:hypothetical protein B0H11DRAFT_2259000 [Mycena galericulata]